MLDKIDVFEQYNSLMDYLQWIVEWYDKDSQEDRFCPSAIPQSVADKARCFLETKKRLDREFGPESSGALEHMEKTCVDNARLGDVVRDLCNDLIDADWERFGEKVDKTRVALKGNR